MTVAFYSPLPPAPTGVADYSAALLQELRKSGTVQIAPNTCDIALYHIGNNQLHRTIYDRAIRQPGVVVLHDALLNHFYLGSFRKEEYVAEFVYNYGDWARDEAESLWRDRALSAQDPRFFHRPMLRRIAETARAVVVHNPAAADAVLRHAPSARVVEIPHLYFPQPPPAPDAIARFRHSLRIPPIGFVFAIFGFLRESKRLIPLLRTFHRLHKLLPQITLLVAGQFVSQDLARAAAPLLEHPAIRRAGYLPPSTFSTAIGATDCCINLRYPAAGEASGIAMRAMAAAKPVLVTEGAEWDRFPETALLRLPGGIAEPDALFDGMALLATNPELARQIGQVAACHIQRYHAVSASASAYWDLLCSASLPPS